MSRAFAVGVLSVLGGSAIAFFVLSYGTRALLLFVLALVAAARARPQRVAIGGQLIGFGGTIGLLSYPWIAVCSTAGEGAAQCRQSTAYEILLLVATIFVVGGAFLVLRRAEVSH